MSIMRTEGLRFSRSRRVFLAFSAAAMVAALSLFSSPARAEAQEATQVALTAKQIEQYLASYKELTPLFEKLDAAGDNPDPKILAAIEASVKKAGFADLTEYDLVANSIVAVLDGVDPNTKQYSDPVALIKNAIGEVQKDKSLSPAQRKQAIAELNAELAEVQVVQHQGNIQLVVKYYDQLAALSQ